MTKLAVDARWMVGRLRGMGRYAHALLQPVQEQVTALLPEGYAASSYQSVFMGRGFFPYWEQVILPKLCASLKVDQLLCPYNTAPLSLPRRTELTLVVHDLIYLEPWTTLPPSVSMYQTAGRMYRRQVVPRVIHRADRLLTVSEFTRKQICDRFQVDPSRIQVIPNSVSDDWFVARPRSQAERGNYILAVAGEAPSKNLRGLIEAFSKLVHGIPHGEVKPSLRVVGVSSSYQASFREQARRRGVEEVVQFIPFISDENLKEMYRNATLFVMPSLHEGFGIPLIEAMASGTPIACSDTSSLPEIVGHAAWLFNPYEVDDMASKLFAAWTSPAERRAKSMMGLSRAKEFNGVAVGAMIDTFWKNI